MTMQRKMAVVVLALAGLTLLNHGVSAVEREQAPYETYSRVVLPGQSLWDICSKLESSEDVRSIIDRARVDNDIPDPGALQPGKVLQIRVKR